jgi:hypothetical protein
MSVGDIVAPVFFLVCMSVLIGGYMTNEDDA